MRFVPQVPHEKLRIDHRHPLDGYMDKSTPDSIENAFMYYPPTRSQMVDLLLEESRGLNREIVFRIFVAYQPRQ